ncbi:MAG: hypothetical protein PUD20_05625 [bacterium]|nr:hypothetical protein [bacterium]
MGFPDINTLEPLADALGVSIVELMQAKKNANEELISTEEVEEILLDTIHLSETHSKCAKVTGTVILTIFAVSAVWLIGGLVTDWNILNLIVPSILAGLIAWAAPIWKMTLSRNHQITLATIISFGSALSAILFRIINIAHDININDMVAVIDTIDGEVMIVTVFIAITIVLNVCEMFFSKRSGTRMGSASSP